MNANQWIDDDCGESPGLALFLSATTIVTGKLSPYSNALEPSTHFWEVSNGLGIVPAAEQLCDFGGFCPWHWQGFPVTLLGLPRAGAPRPYDFHHATSASARIVCAPTSVCLTRGRFPFGLGGGRTIFVGLGRRLVRLSPIYAGRLHCRSAGCWARIWVLCMCVHGCSSYFSGYCLV